MSKRERLICGGLSWLGVSLGPARNRSGKTPVNESRHRACAVHVLPLPGGPADRLPYLGIVLTEVLSNSVGKAVW
jgi:hypothetical protein